MKHIWPRQNPRLWLATRCHVTVGKSLSLPHFPRVYRAEVGQGISEMPARVHDPHADPLLAASLSCRVVGGGMGWTLKH